MKFIEQCHKNPTDAQYIEEHHICPKANDMFPEYTSFRAFPWNKIKLSFEQHVLAHLLLWKAYGGSQAYCMHYMINVAGDKKKIPGKFIRQYAAKLKTETRHARKGFSTYKDSSGTKHFLHRDDPKIKELNLVGNNAGLTMTEDSRERMRIAKDAHRKITLHFMTYERTLYITDPEFAILIDYGWTPYTQQERHEESKLTRLTAHRKATQGKFQFSLPDGTFYGFLDIDDPKINELSLIKPIRSEKQIAQAQAQALANASNKEMQMRKGKTMSTRKWFHDPVNGVNRRLLECPIGWKDGRAESSESNKGKETWNDGIRNYMIRDRSEVQSNWTRGMAPRNSQN